MQQQTAVIRNLFAVYGRKVIFACMLFLAAGKVSAQNLLQYENRVLHFGFTLNGTYNMFQMNTSEEFLGIDSLKNIRQEPFVGFGIGAIVDLKMGKYLNLRLTGPGISFAQRNLYYDFAKKEQNKKVEIESVYLDVPLELKYKSERHWNTRFYMMCGIRYTYDLTSNVDAPRSLSDPIVALKRNSFSYEVGVGMDLYFPFFKLSPELKFSQSINNVLVKDDFVYTKALNSIFSRIFTFSFHFE